MKYHVLLKSNLRLSWPSYCSALVSQPATGGGGESLGHIHSVEIREYFTDNILALLRKVILDIFWYILLSNQLIPLAQTSHPMEQSFPQLEKLKVSIAV